MSNRLTVFQGDKFVIPYAVTNVDTGAVIDITNISLTLNIYNGKTLVITKEKTSHLAPTLGTGEFDIDETETDLWPCPSVLQYWVVATYSDGSPFTGTNNYIEVKKPRP